MKKNLLNLFTVAALWSAQVGQAFACAVCLSGDGAGNGYNASLLFLMSTPYLVVGAIAGGLLVTYRRARRRCEEAEHGVASGPEQEESGR